MFTGLADINSFWSIISICFFIGGLTIGWVAKDWKKSEKRRGDGRWD
jgi:hypothetical protein|tara:strand:+ start:131 stop:271 length:141 start_codon:yes stop_codon:yes gene_type:complete